MKKADRAAIHAALDSINASYGTGNIFAVHFNTAEVDCPCPPGECVGYYETLRQYGTGRYVFHVKGRKVYARGTSRVY